MHRLELRHHLVQQLDELRCTGTSFSVIRYGAIIHFMTGRVPFLSGSVRARRPRKLALIVGTSGWTVLLWSQGLLATPTEIVGAAVLAFANTAVGVLVHQVLLAFVRRVRGHPATQVEATR